MSDGSQSRLDSDVVASAIRELRTRSGETQMEFALRAGVALSTLARYESGAQNPKVSVVKRFASLAKQSEAVDLLVVFDQAIAKKAKQKTDKDALNRNRLRTTLSNVNSSLEELARDSVHVLAMVARLDPEEFTDDANFQVKMPYLIQLIWLQEDVLKTIKNLISQKSVPSLSFDSLRPDRSILRGRKWVDRLEAIETQLCSADISLEE